MTNAKANLFHLIIIRLVMLINIAVLYYLGVNKTSPVLFAAVILYNLCIMLYWNRLTELFKRRPALLLVDLSVTAAIIWVTGGYWSSPYFLYGLASIMISSFFLKTKHALLATGYFIALLTLGLMLNEAALADIVRNKDIDIVLSSYMGLFLLTVVFGYPANVIQQIWELRSSTSYLEEELQKTEALISAISPSYTLSCREFEILECLSKGLANLKIAEELHITERTVKNHLYRIYKKLGVSSREEAVVYFHSRYGHKSN